MTARSSTSRRRLSGFVLAGLAGLLLACAGSALLLAIAPALRGAALLAPEARGTALWAALWLAVMGLLVTMEMPLMLYTMLKMARRAVPASALNLMHFGFTAFPVVYGFLGTLLTGERWWLALMALFAPLRLGSSLLIAPHRPPAPRMAAATARPSAGATVVEAARPSGLSGVRGFVLDMDGVIYRGSQVRTGAQDFFNYLNQQQIPYLCLTNNAAKTSAMFEATVQGMGLPVRADQILGSARATAEWLAGSMPPGARLMPVGEAGLREELAEQGFAIVEGPPADAVVVGIDRELTYARLRAATRAIRQGARFIGTNPDPTFPAEDGLVPGNGATLAFLEAATSREPTIVGKPNRAMMQVALTHLGLPAAHVAMVGDRLDTDILGGQRVGMVTVMLRGGVTPDDEIASAEIQADYCFDDLGGLLDAYRALHPN